MPLNWETEGPTWPHHNLSEFVSSGSIRWHIQQFGLKTTTNAKGNKPYPITLLIHGTGASTHTWRDVAPLLAQKTRVVAIDLPGHGFTSHPSAQYMSLPGMAAAVTELCRQQNWQINCIAGHSAGAAIAVSIAVSIAISFAISTAMTTTDESAVSQQKEQAPHVISFNGALLPLQSLSGQLFSPIAKVLAANPLVPKFFSWRAQSPRVLDELLRSTGSALSPEGRALYGRLVANSDHAAGALAMMANWDLETFSRLLPSLKSPLTLVAANNDKTISPRTAFRVKTMIEHAKLVTIDQLGHLAHEENPKWASQLILESTN